MKRYLAVFAIALCVLLSGCATNESKADRLFDEGSYREALELYESLDPLMKLALKKQIADSGSLLNTLGRRVG